MTPRQVALDMMGKNLDPGLIEHYIALELRRDPTAFMSPLARAMYTLERGFEALARAFSAIPRQSDFRRIS